jgi:hypothetical protein
LLGEEGAVREPEQRDPVPPAAALGGDAGDERRKDPSFAAARRAAALPAYQVCPRPSGRATVTPVAGPRTASPVKAARLSPVEPLPSRATRIGASGCGARASQ